MKIDKKDLGNWLAEKRVYAGLTQQYVCEELGYTCCQSISNWERGTASIPDIQLLKLIEVYDIPIKQFKRDMIGFFKSNLEKLG